MVTGTQPPSIGCHDSIGPTAPGQERAGFTDSAHDPEKLRILLQVLRATNVWGRAWGEDPQDLQSVPGTGTDVGCAKCWMMRSVVIVHSYMGEKRTASSVSTSDATKGNKYPEITLFQIKCCITTQPQQPASLIIRPVSWNIIQLMIFR